MTEDSSTAVSAVATRRGDSNVVKPTAATSRALRGGWITVTISGPTASGRLGPA